MGEFSRQGMEGIGTTSGVTPPFSTDGIQRLSRDGVGMGSGEITVPGQGNPEDQAAVVSAVPESSHRQQAVVDHVGETAARQVVQAAGMDPGTEPRRSTAPVPPRVFLPPAVVESVATPPEPEPESGKLPTAEAAPPFALPAQESTVKAEPHTDATTDLERPDLPPDMQPNTKYRWGHNQAYNAVRAAQDAGIDVVQLVPRRPKNFLTHTLLPHILAGEQPADIATEIGTAPSTVTRVSQKVAVIIGDHMREKGVPEGLDEQQFYPQVVEEREPPTGYGLEPLKQRIAEKGIPLATLAEEYGVAPSTIARLLNGERMGKITLAKALIDKAYADDPETGASVYAAYLEDYRHLRSRAQVLRNATVTRQ